MHKVILPFLAKIISKKHHILGNVYGRESCDISIYKKENYLAR